MSAIFIDDRMSSSALTRGGIRAYYGYIEHLKIYDIHLISYVTIVKT